MPRLPYIVLVLLLPVITAAGTAMEAGPIQLRPQIAGFDMEPYSVRTDTPGFTIPFTRAGNLILIKAKADSTEGNFVLDTGAPGLVLNLTYFRDYPTTSESTAEQTGITGAASAALKTTVKQFNIGPFAYDNIHADLANLGHIENSKNVRILGLIGLEFFKDCEMIVDFENGVIHLEYLSKKNTPFYTAAYLKDESAYTTVPIDIMDNRIITTTELGGKKLKMIIDCAAETNILNSKLPNKLMEFVTISRKVKLMGSGSKQVDALYGDVSNMKVGSESIGKLPVLITNLENTCFAYNGCIDGVLGFDFLSLHKIGFNFVKHKMYIWK